jgi:hypothetical protein
MMPLGNMRTTLAFGKPALACFVGPFSNVTSSYCRANAPQLCLQWKKDGRQK